VQHLRYDHQAGSLIGDPHLIIARDKLAHSRIGFLYRRIADRNYTAANRIGMVGTRRLNKQSIAIFIQPQRVALEIDRWVVQQVDRGVTIADQRYDACQFDNNLMPREQPARTVVVSSYETGLRGALAAHRP
jgi:hypothetical protein